MNGSFYSCKQNRVYWTIIAISILNLAILLVPLTTLLQIGTQISPTRTLLDKTILLFQILKVVLPLFGVLAIIWMSVPNPIRQVVAHKAEDIANSRWTLPAILVVGLLLSLGWVFFYPTQPYADSQWYFDLANRLVNGQGYVYDLTSLRPTAVWPVGYPAFLALLFTIFGSSTLVARLANVVLVVSIIYLTYQLARRMLSDRLIAVLSAAFMALLPSVIVYTSLICTDILFMTLVVLILNLALGKQGKELVTVKRSVARAFLTGILNGALILTRATGLTLFPLWIVVKWIAIRRGPAVFKRLSIWTLAFAIGTGVIVLPWTIRNYIHFHRLIPVSTNGGANFWIGNNPLANGGFVFPRDPNVNPLLPLIGDEMAVDDTGYQLGLQFIQENPGRIPKLLLAKVFYLYNSNDFGLGWNIRSAVAPDRQAIEPFAYALTDTVYILLAGLAICGLLLLVWCRVSDLLAWIGVIFSLYWTVIHLPYFGSDRFSLPLLPFLTTYAALGLSTILRYGRQS